MRSLLGLVLLAAAAFLTPRPVEGGLIFTSDGSGADARVRRSLADSNFGADSFVAIQNTNTTTTARKTYLRFDLSSLGGVPVASADLLLTPNADFSVGSGVTFDLYGLNNLDAGESWSEAAITWNNAPANNTSSNNGVLGNATLIGSFTFLSDFSEGVPITFSSSAIANFLNADTNNLVTFILTRQETGTTNFTFASKENLDEYQFPTLDITLVPEPSTFVLGTLALSMCAAYRLRGRKRVPAKG